jgi:hypothetical protein
MTCSKDALNAAKTARFQQYWTALHKSAHVKKRDELAFTWNFISMMQLLDREMCETLIEEPCNNAKKTTIDDVRGTILDVYMEGMEKMSEKDIPMSVATKEDDFHFDHIIDLLVRSLSICPYYVFR